LAAVNGKRPFSIFGIGGTNVFDYFVSNRDAPEWEIGTGHCPDANTLVRDTVALSSNANAAVNFSAGTKDIWNDAPAARQKFNLLGAAIASAANLNLDGATGDVVDVSGNATITAITLAAGQEVCVRFTGAAVLTNGVNLALPGAENITCEPGDFAIFRSYGATVFCVLFRRAARRLEVAGNSGVLSFPTANKILTIKKSLNLDGTDGAPAYFVTGTASVPNGGNVGIGVGANVGVMACLANNTTGKYAVFFACFNQAVLLTQAGGGGEWVVGSTPGAGQSGFIYNNGNGNQSIFNNTGGTCTYQWFAFTGI
jgi:hypothetical protein